MKRVLNKAQEVERSIIRTYRKEIWSKFIEAVQDYELIKENDKVMVCISGGKDSFLLAKCMQELVKHGKIKFDAVYVTMDPGYNKENRKVIEENSKLLGIPLQIFDSDIYDVVEKVDFKSPCYFCARMRRGHLYAKAQELGCNKIALGHHLDDVIETTLLSMFYGAEIKTMMPKLYSDNFEGIQLIRPMCLIKENDIIAWKKYNKLTFLNCACKFTEMTDKNEIVSKRKEMKQLINEMRKINKDVDHNIFKAMENVNMSCILGWHDEDKKYSFLDNYDKK